MKSSVKFGQLPLLYVDDNADPIIQSGAILRYIGALNGNKLYPQDKVVLIEEIIGVVEDLVRSFMPSLKIEWKPQAFGYPEGFERTSDGKAVVKKLREEFVRNKLPLFLRYFTEFLKVSDGEFLCGSQVTIADCMLLPILRTLVSGRIEFIQPKCIESCSEVISYIKRVMEVPEIKSWYENPASRQQQGYGVGGGGMYGKQQQGLGCGTGLGMQQGVGTTGLGVDSGIGGVGTTGGLRREGGVEPGLGGPGVGTTGTRTTADQGRGAIRT